MPGRIYLPQEKTLDIVKNIKSPKGGRLNAAWGKQNNILYKLIVYEDLSPVGGGLFCIVNE
jgi:hypothetical protein